MSELGEVGASNAIVMNLETAILGISILMFAFGLHYGVTRDKGWKVGTIIMLVGGICMIGGGIFPCDPGCVSVSFVWYFTRDCVYDRFFSCNICTVCIITTIQKF